MSEDSDFDEEERHLPSFSFVPVLLLGTVLFLLGPVVGKYGAFALFCLLFLAILFETFSSMSYKKMKQSYPEMDRRFWMINCLLFHLLLPVLIGGVLLVVVYFLV